MLLRADAAYGPNVMTPTQWAASASLIECAAFAAAGVTAVSNSHSSPGADWRSLSTITSFDTTPVAPLTRPQPANVMTVVWSESPEAYADVSSVGVTAILAV